MKQLSPLSFLEKLFSSWKMGCCSFLIAAADSSVANIKLLEPIGTTATIPIDTSSPGSIIGSYLGALMPFLVATTAGITVLMIIVGGVQMMMSGGKMESSEGKERIIASLVGLVLLLFSATVLYLLNADQFRMVTQQ